MTEYAVPLWFFLSLFLFLPLLAIAAMTVGRLRRRDDRRRGFEVSSLERSERGDQGSRPRDS